MFSNWLNSHPDLVVLGFFIFGAGLSLYLATKIFEKIPSLKNKTDFDDEWLIAVTSALVALSAVVLGFSLMLVLTRYEKVETSIAIEAESLNALDRTLGVYDESKLLNGRQAILVYAKSIIADEWPQLAHADSSEITNELFKPVFKEISALQPTNFRHSVLFAELIKKLDELEAARTERIASSQEGLHLIFWIISGLIFSGVLVASALGLVRCNPVRSVSLYLQVLALAGLTAIVFIIDKPFKGQTAVSPEPIHTAIAHIEARQALTIPK